MAAQTDAGKLPGHDHWLIVSTPVFTPAQVVRGKAPGGGPGDLDIARVHDQVSGPPPLSPGEAS